MKNGKNFVTLSVSCRAGIRLSCALLTVLLGFFPTSAIAVETDKLIIMDGATGEKTFSVTSGGTVIGTKFVGDGSGLTNIPAGPIGPAGADGISAYQQWLNAGNTGTEVDFLAALVGPQGETGPSGPEGLSAYEVWLAAGNTGTEDDFLASLSGAGGSGESLATQADILSKIAEPTSGAVLTIQQGSGEGNTAPKLSIEDSTGVPKAVINASGWFGVGTNNPQAQVHAVDNSGPAVPSQFRGIVSAEHNDGVHSPLVIFKKSRGTESNPTAVAENDYIGVFQAFGHDGSSYRLPVAQFGFRVDGPVTTNTIPTNFFVETGAPARVERFRVTSEGNFGIGTPVPTQKLEVNGGIRINTSAAKPACTPAVRGTFWFTQGVSNDQVEVCAKENGAMVWKPLW